MQTADLGEMATLTSYWFDVLGAAAEPSAITLVITKPDGTTVNKTKADLTQGATTDVWAYSQANDVLGAWRYQFSGTVAGAPVTQPEQIYLVGLPAASASGPCEPWCNWSEVGDCDATDFTAYSTEQREHTLDLASSTLFDLTKRYHTGICSITRTLCLTCATCWPGSCGCGPRTGIDLGYRQPVWGAWDVFVDGVELAQSAYTIVGRRWLTRTDGESWPRGVDVTDSTSFRATWAFGRQVPPGARYAAALFAAEIAKGCMGAECEIPSRITSIIREGVSYPVLDSLSMIQEGRTGVALTDLWVVADNKGRASRPGIFVPGAHGVKRYA